MSCNDNCNPINLPVIQGPQGLKGDKGDKGDTGDTGPAGPAGPGELLLGKTLYVSKLGNDATAVPYDIANHYLTITSAKNDAVAGDTIVVHPGVYTEAALYKNGVNYHFLNGAILELKQGQIAFDVNTAFGKCNVSGDLEVTMFAGSTSVVVLNVGGASSTVSFECKKITIGGFAFNLQQGNVTINVKESASSSNVVLLLSTSSTSSLVFNAKKLIWTGNNETLSLSTGAIFIGSNYGGKAIITVDEITNTGSGGTNMITVSGINGSVYIRCPKVINNFNGFATVGLMINNQIPYFRFEGNIYSNESGSLAGGVCSAIQQGSTYTHYVEIIGDIYVDQNYAMYVNNGPARIKYSGNMYGRNTGGGLTINGEWPGPFPNGGAVPVTFLVYIGLETSLTAIEHSYLWFKDATLNQFASGSVCIYKKQAYLPGETSQYLQLDNVDFWVDGESFCINGNTTAVQNKIQVNACNSNVIVSPTITQVGENILINAALISYDNPYSNT